MPIFGRTNDRKLIKHFSKEVMEDIIDTPVIVFKPYITKSNTNLYGEGVNGDKAWRTGVLLHAMVNREDQEYMQTDYGIDINQKITYSFLNEDIMSKNSKFDTGEESAFSIQIGDLVYYDSNYWEIDSLTKNQYLFGRNQNVIEGDAQDFGFSSTTDMHGESLSTIAAAHLTRKSRLNIESPSESNIKSVTSEINGLYR